MNGSEDPPSLRSFGEAGENDDEEGRNLGLLTSAATAFNQIRHGGGLP